MVTARVTAYRRMPPTEGGGRIGMTIALEPWGHDYNRPLVRVDLQDGQWIEVDAEHLFRAASAVWQAVRPLGKSDA